MGLKSAKEIVEVTMLSHKKDLNIFGMATRINKALSRRITANIRLILIRKGWRQEDIHLNSDLDKGNLSRYFAGTRDYTLLSLQRIAEALGVDIGALLKK